MKRPCSLCHADIPAVRLAAVPTTYLCVTCKSGNDEPPLRADARCLSGSIAQGSIGDLEEMQLQSRQMGGLL